MNDRDLWPIHIIFFGFLIALVISTIQSVVGTLFGSPVLLVLVLVALIVVWLFGKRN